MSRKVILESVRYGLIVGMLAGVMLTPVTAGAQTGAPNLLKNPGFDWPAQTNGDICAPGWQKDNAITPNNWVPFWTCKNDQEKNQDQINRPPEFRVMTVEMAQDRVRSYPTAASFFTFWSLNRSMGLYQIVRNVASGTKLRFSVWANLLSTNSNQLPLSSSREPGGLQVRACIHTTGNIFLSPDLNDPALTCGPWARPYDTWSEISVEATAAASEVAVVIDSTAEYPVIHNDVQVDDASLTVVGAGAAPAAPVAAVAPQAQPRAASAPVNDNAPRVIVKGETANVRAAPSLAGQILASAPQGMSFAVRAYTSDKQWFQVEYTGGPGGVAYVHNSVVDLNAAAQNALNGRTASPATTQPQQGAASTAPTIGAASAQVVVNTGGDRLNVRATPASNGPVLGKVQNGASLEVKGVSPDKQWWRITYSGGTDGTAWVMAQFVTPNAAARQIAGI